TKECLTKFPSISGLIKAVEPLKQASNGKSKLKFSELLKKAQEVEKLANRQRTKIQSLGCAEILHDIDPCIKPVDWNCKNQPFGIDFEFLEPVKKSNIEEKAFQSYQLYKSVNLLRVCCGDLGCLDSGLGIPNVLNEKARLLALVQLAGSQGAYADVALKSLELTSSSLSKANCSCPAPKPKESLRISEELTMALSTLDKKSKRTKLVEKSIKPIKEILDKGFPQAECIIPGE
ncbi:MAG: hypothetical protein ACK5V3_04535, partial [Bdellovibrionales bacterium]